MANDVLDQLSTNTAVPVFREYRKAIQVREAAAWAFVGDATDWLGVFFDNEIPFAALHVGLDPCFLAE